MRYEHAPRNDEEKHISVPNIFRISIKVGEKKS
jgi:hypothetical protein